VRCLLIGKACNLKQTPRTTIKLCCVVAWQCPSTYCCPHCWNRLETRVWSSVCPSSSVWSTQRGIKGPSIHLRPISEGSSASKPRCSAESRRKQCMQGSLLSWEQKEAVHSSLAAQLRAEGSSACKPRCSAESRRKQCMQGSLLSWEQKEAVHASLAAQLESFFSEGIRKLVQRRTKSGDRVGLWCYCKFTVCAETMSLIQSR
jgi:hypothetical protein